MTIIRELVLHLAKVIPMLKHSVQLRRYILCGDVAACRRAVCVLSRGVAVCCRAVFMLCRDVAACRRAVCVCVCCVHNTQHN